MIRHFFHTLDRSVLEITRDLQRKSVDSPNNIHWLKQLRYYNEEQNTCVRILQTNLTYGYEYMGDFDRLIITSETERCYR